MRFTLLLAAAALASQRFLEPDKGGASGGTAKSPVDELADLRASVKILTDSRAADAKTIDALNADIDAARKSATAAKDALQLATDKIASLESTIATANDKVADLEKTAKTVDQAATEKAAANGVIPAPKDAAKLAAAAKDKKALYEEYQKLMADGKSRDASKFWAAHEKDLLAYAEETQRAN